MRRCTCDLCGRSWLSKPGLWKAMSLTAPARSGSVKISIGPLESCHPAIQAYNGTSKSRPLQTAALTPTTTHGCPRCAHRSPGAFSGRVQPDSPYYQKLCFEMIRLACRQGYVRKNSRDQPLSPSSVGAKFEAVASPFTPVTRHSNNAQIVPRAPSHNFLSVGGLFVRPSRHVTFRIMQPSAPVGPGGGASITQTLLVGRQDVAGFCP